MNTSLQLCSRARTFRPNTGNLNIKASVGSTFELLLIAIDFRPVCFTRKNFIIILQLRIELLTPYKYLKQ